MSRDRAKARKVEGTDAFSYGRGRARSRVHDKPLWEQEGTPWTLLFGKASPGKKLQFRDAIDGEPGQMLGIVKMLLRTGLVGAGYACRWASVRGSIPQPLVVVAISTAALSARRHRLRDLGQDAQPALQFADQGQAGERGDRGCGQFDRV